MKLFAVMPSSVRYAWLIFPLAALGLCGCRSANKPASASFASVVIANRSVDEIRRTATAVFTEAGYETYSSVGGGLIFEKEGTRKNQVMHGGWIDDSPVRERVRSEIVTLHNGTHRLQCKVYMVQDPGAFSAQEKRLANFRSGPYQELLNQVAAMLK